MKKIGIEEHVAFPPIAEIEDAVMQADGFPSLFDPDRMVDTLGGPMNEQDPTVYRFPTMDENEIAIQILSIGGIPLQRTTDPEAAIKLAMSANDYVAGLVADHPDRFFGFGALPMQDPEAAVKEIERCVNELGFVGFMLHGPTVLMQDGKRVFSYYDEDRYDIVWAKLAELDTPLYFHVSSPEADQIRVYDGYDELLGNTWNWGYYGATQALRCVFGGVFERHPNAKLILGHMGESLPYLLGRLDEGYDCRRVWKKGRMTQPPSYYFKRNIYVTTSGGYYPETLSCAISALGIDKILFANDYPHYPTETSVKQVEDCPITDEQKQAIYWDNAVRLFKLDV